VLFNDFKITRRYKIMKEAEERIEALEKELEKVCGTYEDDCSKCPKQAECGEYIRLCRDKKVRF
jgi:hypothetical protein